MSSGPSERQGTSRQPWARKLGHDDVVVDAGLLAEHLLDLDADSSQLIGDRQPVRRRAREPGGQLVLEPRHPYLEELVQVAREYGQELRSLEERLLVPFGQSEHPAVELEPGELSVDVRPFVA